MEMIVGCVTRMPEGYEDRYFNIEVVGKDMDGNVTQYEDNKRVNLHWLKIDIQPMVADIVDEIVYLIDPESGDMLWELEDGIE